LKSQALKGRRANPTGQPEWTRLTTRWLFFGGTIVKRGGGRSASCSGTFGVGLNTDSATLSKIEIFIRRIPAAYK